MALLCVCEEVKCLLGQWGEGVTSYDVVEEDQASGVVVERVVEEASGDCVRVDLLSGFVVVRVFEKKGEQVLWMLGLG